ncbi:hypothetical protein SERLA73DRAFT_50455, partial [Serpula lacrymans var. lacrymans S7.3]
RPRSKEELFNLQHTQVRNCIERIFSIFKHCFWILLCPPKFNMDIQACITSSLCILHNYIQMHNPDNIHKFSEDVPSLVSTGSLSDGLPTELNQLEANLCHNRIAMDMWVSSYAELQARGAV